MNEIETLHDWAQESQRQLIEQASEQDFARSLLNFDENLEANLLLTTVINFPFAYLSGLLLPSV